jgi:hypothetical protein
MIDVENIAKALGGKVSLPLAQELTALFVQIRQDYATKTLERSSPGKFVETFIQCCQFMTSGRWDKKPKADSALQNLESEIKIPEGLRVCAARYARAMYTLRNRRSIAHKNAINPNISDLRLIHESAAWIMAEMVRNASDLTMREAEVLIDRIQAPVGSLVEEIGGTRLVHANVSIRSELLILLHSYYPEWAPLSHLRKSLAARNPRSVSNQLSAMSSEKLVHHDEAGGYRLTQPGYAAAMEVIKSLLTAAAA